MKRRKLAERVSAISIVFAWFSVLFRYSTTATGNFVEYEIFGSSPSGLRPAPSLFPPLAIRFPFVLNVLSAIVVDGLD